MVMFVWALFNVSIYLLVEGIFIARVASGWHFAGVFDDGLAGCVWCLLGKLVERLITSAVGFIVACTMPYYVATNHVSFPFWVFFFVPIFPTLVFVGRLRRRLIVSIIASIAKTATTKYAIGSVVLGRLLV